MIICTAGSQEDPLTGWDPRPRADLDRIRRQFKDADGDNIDLVDELLAERHLEAAAEDRAQFADEVDVVAGAAGSDDATISAVNYIETLQKAARAGIAVEDVDVALEALGITVSPFGRLDARLTASLYRHQSGLSLADRVSVALARSLSSIAFTADHAWENWADDLGVAVRFIR